MHGAPEKKFSHEVYQKKKCTGTALKFASVEMQQNFNSYCVKPAKHGGNLRWLQKNYSLL